MSKILYHFPKNIFTATILARRKRFFIDALYNDNPICAHTNNSGSMLGLIRKGREALFSVAENLKRKLPYTLELIKLNSGWVGVNTLVPNKLLALAYQQNLIPEFTNYSKFKSEVKIGNSRLDFMLEGINGKMWIEAKNVTLVEEETAYFPDAPTARGQKHLQELIKLAHQGQKVCVFYLIQRQDAFCFGPADFIDQNYAKYFWEGETAGIISLPYVAKCNPKGIELGMRLPIIKF